MSQLEKKLKKTWPLLIPPLSLLLILPIGASFWTPLSLWVFFAALIPLALIGSSQNTTHHQPVWFKACGIGLLMWALISLSWSVAFAASIWWSLIWVIGAFFALLLYRAPAVLVDRYLDFYLMSAAAFTIVSLLYISAQGEWRLVGTFGPRGPNAAAAYLLPAVIIGCFGGTKDKLWHRVCGAVALVGLIATGSRGGILALTLSLILAAVAAPKMRRNAVLLLGSLIASFMIFVTLAITRIGPITKLDWHAASSDDSSLKHRLFLAETSEKLVKMHPITGSGLGSFGLNPELASTPTNTTSVHNAFLQLGVELGLVGLGLGLLLTWHVGKSSWHLIASNRQSSLGLATIAALMYAGMDISSSYPSLIFLTLALCALTLKVDPKS